MNRLSLALLAQSLLLTACFTPSNPADADTDPAASSSGDGGGATDTSMPGSTSTETTAPGATSSTDDTNPGTSGTTDDTAGTTGTTGDPDSSTGPVDPGTTTDAGGSTFGQESSDGGPVCMVDADQGSNLQFDHVILPPWQSFTTGITGDLVEIDAMPNTFCGGDGISGDLTIYAGEGLGGAVLYQAPYPGMFMPGLNITAFQVDPPIAVVAGLTYTWELTGTCGLRYGNGNPYAGGMGGGNPDLDMVFETRVETCQ